MERNTSPAAGSSTLFIWPHGPGKLSEFLDYMNNVHENIQLTMETDRDCHIPIIDIDIYRKADGSLGRKFNRNPPQEPLP
jgi:hypothetical protein